jgi:hypothetical protein
MYSSFVELSVVRHVRVNIIIGHNYCSKWPTIWLKEKGNRKKRIERKGNGKGQAEETALGNREAEKKANGKRANGKGTRKLSIGNN